METLEEKLRRLIAQDQIDAALNELDDSIVHCKNTLVEIDEGITNLHNTVTGFMQRNNSLNKQIIDGILQAQEIIVTKNRIVRDLLNLVSSLNTYSSFQNYLNRAAELEAWNTTKSINQISSYQQYLSEYPNGGFRREANLQIERLQTQELETELLKFLTKYSRYYFSPAKIKKNQYGFPSLARYSTSEIRSVLDRLKSESLIKSKPSKETGQEIYKIK